MTDPYLSIVSGIGTIPLNGVATRGAGVEAQPGTTGLGLPPMNVVFDTGAGDGSIFISRSVSSRTLDVPVKVIDENRAGLKTQMRALAQIATRNDLKLQWTDGDDTYQLDVHLVSGGDYAYGQDTEGNCWANTTLTFQSESPYWENVELRTAALTVTQTGTDANGLSLYEAPFTPIVNEGSVETFPTFVVDGPVGNVALVRDVEMPNGDGTSSTATIPYLTYSSSASARVVIDCEAGTVTSSGVNAYANLGPAPTFFSIPASPDVIPNGKMQLSEASVYLLHQFICDPAFKSAAGAINWNSYSLSNFAYMDAVVNTNAMQVYASDTVSYSTKRLSDGSGVFVGSAALAATGNAFTAHIKAGLALGNVWLQLAAPQSADQWDAFNNAALVWWTANAKVAGTAATFLPITRAAITYSLKNVPSGAVKYRTVQLSSPQLTPVYGASPYATEDVSAYTGHTGDKVQWASYTARVGNTIPSSVIPSSQGGTNSDGQVVDKIYLSLSLRANTWLTRPSLTDYTALASPWGNWSGDTPDSTDFDFSWTGTAQKSMSQVINKGAAKTPVVEAQWYEREWLVI